jgi:hypothetical protein
VILLVVKSSTSKSPEIGEFLGRGFLIIFTLPQDFKENTAEVLVGIHVKCKYTNRDQNLILLITFR